ncbi:hypothetical protein F66182_4849 [Fusarium sp. NRRL 66182]|nr:hypothetical protein F66182_4849 [Fusarium sp. NRRL 66182]
MDTSISRIETSQAFSLTTPPTISPEISTTHTLNTTNIITRFNQNQFSQVKMGYMKTDVEYFDTTVPFTPLPKYGHLSEKTPEYAAVEQSIRDGYAPLHNVPDFAAARAVAGDPDAVMPPGGPDRYKDVVTELIDIPTRDGALIELKVYKSVNVDKNAVLMYRMHGGGWCLGRHEVDGIDNVYAATNPSIIVVSVDYRMAPENPFPIPINDCYDGLAWCKSNADKLGADPEHIIISGGSAGAQLAASLVLDCRENGITGIIAQVLHFPPTCHPKFFPRDRYEYGSYIQNQDNAVLDTLNMETVYDAYVPNAKPDYRHSPLLARSHEGLPPTLIQCGGVDVLRDDAFAYADVLRDDGVDVEIHFQVIAMGYLLLQGGTVLIHGQDDKVSAIKTDILIENDRIARIGKDLVPLEDADIIDCTDKLISPGFVDTHHHMWQAPLKGLFADCSFSHYMGIETAAGKYLTADDVFWGNLAGCMEAVDAGTTTALDHAHMNWSQQHSKEAIAGTLSSGIRSIFAYTPTTRLKEAEPALRFDDEPVAKWVMDTFEELARSSPLKDEGSVVRLGFGFDYYFLPQDVVVSTFNKVRSLGAKVITSHYTHFNRNTEISTPALLSSYHLLDDGFIISHGGGITAQDVKLLGEKNAHVSATPSTEQSMAVGPSVCFRDHLPGIDKLCSLGIDCHSATSSSIVNEMRTGLLFARGTDSNGQLNRGKLPDDVFHKVEEVYNMGTIQGARALGMDKEIGSIAVGKKADLAIIHAMTPSMFGAAQQDPVGAIVLHSSIGDIDTVIIDGIIRKLDGKLKPVSKFAWKNDGFSRSDVQLNWRAVADKTLEIQQRIVERLAEHDTRALGDQIIRIMTAG